MTFYLKLIEKNSINVFKLNIRDICLEIIKTKRYRMLESLKNVKNASFKI